MLWARLLPGVNESSLPGTLWNIGWSHWQQHVPCPAQHLGQVGSARGFLGNLFGKRGLESMGKRWWHQAGAWLSEKGSRQRNPRGRGEVLISADTVCEASSPEIHLPCRHWGLQWDKQLWHYPWKHILYWQLCLSASRARGEGNIIPQGMVPSFSIGFCSFHAHFEAMGLVEGKRRENVNEQFLNKRFELSLERQRKFSTTFWWAQIEKNRFWKNGIDNMVPTAMGCPVVTNPKQGKAQGLLEPVTKNIFAWETEFGRTQTFSFKPGYSKVAWQQQKADQVIDECSLSLSFESLPFFSFVFLRSVLPEKIIFWRGKVWSLLLSWDFSLWRVISQRGWLKGDAVRSVLLDRRLQKWLCGLLLEFWRFGVWGLGFFFWEGQ